MPGRQYQSSTGYRYGFNGMENDNEVKGSGNSYDFGARIYDPRLGRWLSLDPMMTKYTDLSPYNFSGNNPILFVDKDGRDYGVYINHKDNTIIVKATLYTTNDYICSAESAAMSWNNENGKHQYKVGDGPNAKYYDIKFEVTVKAFDDPQTMVNELYKDKSGEANQYMNVPDDALNGDNGWTGSINKKEGGANKFLVTKSSEKRKTGSHEVGHGLGLGHFLSGLMKKGLQRADDETNITKENVTEVLNHAGIGKMTPKDGMNDQIEDNNPSAKSQIHSEGSAPKTFDDGEVTEKKK